MCTFYLWAYGHSGQIKILESNSRSPVFHIFNESSRGLASIRAFHAESVILTTLAETLDCSHATFIANEVLSHDHN